MAAPRSSWKGFIKLSLVSVPIKAFTANDTSQDVRLNQLHDGCNQRVKYQKVCPEHGELKASEIASGYEYAKDQYVIIEKDELDKLRTESDKAVNIDGFVKPDEIDTLYQAGKTYYLVPDGAAGQKPYALLRQGMLNAKVHAIAKVVIAGREQLVELRPAGKVLAINVLHHAKKVRQPSLFDDELQSQKLTKDELALAGTLIQASTIEKLDYASYRDEYVEKLTKLIQMKVAGEEIVTAPAPEEPKIINLMDALKKSVAEASRRKMAPSVKTPGKAKAKKKAKRATKKRKTG